MASRTSLAKQGGRFRWRKVYFILVYCRIILVYTQGFHVTVALQSLIILQICDRLVLDDFYLNGGF